jgi:hypothetical protein
LRFDHVDRDPNFDLVYRLVSKVAGQENFGNTDHGWSVGLFSEEKL